MDLSPYVEQLRAELLSVAELGGPDARALGERLTAPLESSLRLALLSALSAAAEELTSQLAPGAVDVRLRGSDLALVVSPPPVPDDEPEHAQDVPARHGPAAEVPSDDDGGTARVTLRLPDAVKNRVETAAGREGVSVNTWLVRAVTRALAPQDADAGGGRARKRGSSQQYTGWVR